MKPYGVCTLTVTSPVQTFTEPVTADEVFQFCRLPGDLDGLLLDQLETFITAAREMAEGLQGRDLVVKQYDYRLDFWPYEISLGDHVSSVDLLQHTSDAGVTTTMSVTTDYIVDTTRGLVLPPVNGTWPTTALYPTSAILCRYTVTPPAINKHVKTGILHLVKHWLDAVQFEAGTVAEYPYTITALLSFGARRNFGKT
jgi:hypothetical protein